MSLQDDIKKLRAGGDVAAGVTNRLREKDKQRQAELKKNSATKKAPAKSDTIPAGQTKGASAFYNDFKASEAQKSNNPFLTVGNIQDKLKQASKSEKALLDADKKNYTPKGEKITAASPDLISKSKVYEPTITQKILEETKTTPDWWIDSAVSALGRGDKTDNATLYRNAINVIDDSEYSGKETVREALHDQVSWKARPIQNFAENFVQGFNSMPSSWINFANAITGENVSFIRDMADFVNDIDKGYSARLQKSNEGAEFLGTVANGLGYLSAMFAFGGKTGSKGGVPATLVKPGAIEATQQFAYKAFTNPAFYSTFMSAAGNKYKQERGENKSKIAALGNSTLVGLGVALLEIAGGFGSNSGNTGTFLQTVAGETLEELSQNWYEAIIDKFTTHPETRWLGLDETVRSVLNPRRDFQTALATMAISGIAGAGNLINDVNNFNQERAQKKAQAKRDAKNIAIIKQQLEENQRTRQYIPTVEEYKAIVRNRLNAEESGQTQKAQSAKVGRATTIYSPYQGETPTQTKTAETVRQTIPAASVAEAKQTIIAATNTETQKVSKSWVKATYNKIFDALGGQHSVLVNGMQMDGKPYEVSVNKTTISKVVNDKNFSAEKLAVLPNLDAIIQNADYVGSGTYVPKEGANPKNVTRYDYFETPVSINGQDYIVAFDVEVFPYANNYRTHKVINEMDLIPIQGTDAGPAPAAPEMVSSPSIISIPQNAENSNKNFAEGAENGQAQGFGEAQQVVEDADPYSVGEDLRQEKVSDSERDVVNRMGENLKRKIVWYDPATEPENADVDGYYVNGEIHINEYAKDPAAVVFGHEVFHSLPEADRIALINFFKEHVNQNSAAFQSYKAWLENKYKARYAKEGRSFTEDDLWEEFAAKNMGTFFGDEHFVDKLARENRGIAQRILNAIRDFFDKVGGFFSPKSYTGKVSTAAEAGGFSDATLRKAERMLEKALKNATKSESAAGGFKYDIKSVNGTPVVWITENILKQNKGQPMHQFIANYIAEHIGDVYTLIESGQKVYIGKDLPSEYTQSEYTQAILRNRQNILKAKNKAAANIEEIVEIATNRRWEETEHPENKDAKYGMYRYDTRFGFPVRNSAGDIVGANIYDAELVIRNASDGKKYLYDIVDIKKDTALSAWMSKETSRAADNAADQKNGVSNYSISNSREKVKSKNSTNQDFSGEPVYNLGDDDHERSAFYDNIQEAETVEEAVKQMVDDNIDLFTYEPITNEETMVKAVQEVMAEPDKEALRFLGRNKGAATREDIAKGFVLMQQFQRAGDYQHAVDIAAKLREIGTQKGQEVQVYSILKKMTPEGMLYWSQKELDQVYEELSKDRHARDVRKLRKQLTLSDEEAEFITDTMRRAEKMIDGRDKQVMIAGVQKMLQEKVAESLPKGERASNQIKAYLRISMLLNPKTIVTRNAVSNLFAMPLHEASNALAVMVDKQVAKKTGMRAAAGSSFADIAQGAKQGLAEALEDFRLGIDTRDVDQDRFDLNLRGGRAFRGRNPLAFAERATNFLLDAGDRPFFMAYYLETLNGLMRANNTKVATPEMVEIATQTALERTWQDNNSYTKTVNGLKRLLNKIHLPKVNVGLGDIIIPFAKTPANLLRATIQYSPASLVKAITTDSKALNNAISRGDDAAILKAQRQLVTDYGKGIAGVLIYAVAGVLASAGIVTGREDEEDKDARNFKKNVLGINDYSIRIGDFTLTYNWMQPLGGVFATTADVVEGFQKAKAEGEDISDLGIILKALGSGVKSGVGSLTEQSFLRGVQELFKEEDPIDGLVESIYNLPSQGVPTLLKQMGETVDPLARKTYDKNPLTRIINIAKGKLPYATKSLEPVVDVFGRDVERYGGNNNWFNVFFNPSNVNSAKKTPEAEEVWRLYEQTSEKDFFPKTAPYKISSGGVDYQLTPKEQTEFQRIMGQKASRDLKRLFASDGYKKATDEEKADLAKEIIDRSQTAAKKEILGGRDVFTSGKDKVLYEVNDIKNEYSTWDKVENAADNKRNADVSASAMSYLSAADKNKKLTEGVAKQFQKYVSGIESQKTTELDRELHRLREKGVDYSVSDDSPYDLFFFTKNKVDYHINVPSKDLYDIYVDTEDRFRDAMNDVIGTAVYQNASVKDKKEMLKSVKGDVRKVIREELKAQYGYSIDDDFDKLTRMK